jgi:hypothetical protein
MSQPKKRCCYLCRFHHVYWEESEFAGCECRAWDDPDMRNKHHLCGRGASYSASRESGTHCPRFAFYPPEDVKD